ncbi:MAG: AAA family ATPase [Deltaproteobacteria bacterium]|nr:AAA family ATPase [Deltaproteobacteria bacterium]
MILKRLKIGKFRNLRAVDLRFGSGITILLGKNGTGKTTLLNLIKAILVSDYSIFLESSSEVEFELQGADGVTLEARVVTSRRPVDESAKSAAPSIDQLGVLGSSTPYELAVGYRFIAGDGNTDIVFESKGPDVVIRQGTNERYRQPAQEHFLMLGVAAALCAQHAPDLGLGAFFREVVALIMTVDRYDEALGVFERLVNERGAGVTLEVTENDGPNVRQIFVPGALHSVVHAHAESEKKEQSFLIPAGELPFLERAKELMGFHDAICDVKFLGAQTTDSQQRRYRYGDFNFLFHAHNGDIISHEELSYGQKRLLSFLYLIDLDGPIVIADELVNGLHHQWIEATVASLENRQAFLTSQNPLLLDHLEFTSAEDVEQAFVVCETSQEDEEAVSFSWRNMSEGEAASFYSTYETGIQHVGEILRTKGLW